MKIVLIGAGSAQFGFGMLGDIFSCSALHGSEIALVDINQETLSRVASTATAFVQERKLPYRVAASTDRCEVLAKADFVVISIEVGDRFALWDMDWNLPLQFGIRQVYGENGGPGGLFHALRITPPILDICADIERLCPGATVFCYSNPMTAIATTVHRKFPQLKFLGMCHEIGSLGRYLPDILGTPFENLRLRAAGLNALQRAAGGELRGLGEGRVPRHHGEGSRVLREGDRLQRHPRVRPAHENGAPHGRGLTAPCDREGQELAPLVGPDAVSFHHAKVPSAADHGGQPPR